MLRRGKLKYRLAMCKCNGMLNLIVVTVRTMAFNVADSMLMIYSFCGALFTKRSVGESAVCVDWYHYTKVGIGGNLANGECSERDQ
jgi:hypothetical protein